jgi:hypothetical protein
VLRGKLNLFQRAMLRWSTLYPYTAVHAVRVGHALDRERVERAINAVLEESGLTGLTLDAEQSRYEFRGGAARVPLSVIPGGADPGGAVAREFERQLNEPFPHTGVLAPFRFFAVDAGDTFRLGCAYDHFVGSGDSVVALMARIVGRQNGPAAGALRPPERYPPTYSALVARRIPELLGSLRHAPAAIASGRRACRPPTVKVRDDRTEVHCFRVGASGLAGMIAAAKRWSVTLNDLLIAILMLAIAPLAPERYNASRRREIAIASIMNLRKEFGPEAEGAFGQFLGTFRAQHPVPEGSDLGKLVRDVHAQTDQAKRENLYWHALLVMGGVGLFWSGLSADQKAGVYRARQFPLWAGISLLGVDAIWNDVVADQAPLEYMRTISTGPSVPLVLGVTTAAGVLHAAMSYRAAVLTRETVERVASHIQESIGKLT